MSSSLIGRSVIVTGGSKGIGKGVARAFVDAGAHVMIVARAQEAARQTVAELTGAGREISYLIADVAEPDSADQIAAEALRRHGRIDVLVPNAAVFPSIPVEQIDATAIDIVLRTNLVSTMLGVRACTAELARHGCGRIIIMSSITGPRTGYPNWSIYAASKAGQLGFMRSAALELARYKITVNAILPGVVLTEGLSTVGAEYLARKAATIPLGRLGSVDDIGQLALFLATDEAGYITAQSIVVDGGQLLPESQTASPHPSAAG